MAESTLSMARNELRAEVGDYLGYGRGNTSPYADPAWTTAQAADIDRYVKSGQSRFYNPPGYQWAFLRPTTTLTLTSATNATTLPDNFAWLDGPLTIVTPAFEWPVELTSPEAIDIAYAGFSTAPTGRPWRAALRPINSTTLTAGERWQLYFYPTADQNYTLRYTYSVLPDAVTALLPYPLGGSAHGETLIAACIAAAEREKDGVIGPREQAFQERLAASVAFDKKNKNPRLGPMRDPSNWGVGPYDPNWRYWSNFTVNYVGVP